MVQIDDVQGLVLNALYWDLAVPPHTVRVEVENGWVTLSGTVDRPYQRACAESDARRVPGVVGVTNQIRLAPARAEQGPLATRAGAVLEETGHERHGRGDPQTGL